MEYKRARLRIALLCLRGSAWFIPYGDAAQGQEQSRCAARNSSHAAHGDVRSGFRCARSVLEGTP